MKKNILILVTILIGTSCAIRHKDLPDLQINGMFLKFIPYQISDSNNSVLSIRELDSTSDTIVSEQSRKYLNIYRNDSRYEVFDATMNKRLKINPVTVLPKTTLSVSIGTQEFYSGDTIGINSINSDLRINTSVINHNVDLHGKVLSYRGVSIGSRTSVFYGENQINHEILKDDGTDILILDNITSRIYNDYIRNESFILYIE